MNSETLDTTGNSLASPFGFTLDAISVLSKIATSVASSKKVSAPAELLCLTLETVSPSLAGPIIWFLAALKLSKPPVVNPPFLSVTVALSP